MAFVTPAVIAVLFLARCQGGLRDDELYCEQAVNRLTDCCTGFQAEQVSCSYSSDGCQTNFPNFTVAESQCILDESCEAIVGTGVCGRAGEATVIETTPDGGFTKHVPVCP